MKLSRVDVSAYSNNAIRKEDGRFYMAHEVDAEIDAIKAQVLEWKILAESNLDSKYWKIQGLDADVKLRDDRINELKTENERLRKDAERYHVVRHCDARVLRHISELDGFDKFDARVDSERHRQRRRMSRSYTKFEW